MLVLKYALLSLLSIIIATPAAAADRRNINIFVAPSKVVMQTGIGTSEEMNTLVDGYAPNTTGLVHRLSQWAAPDWFQGKIRVFTRENIKFLQLSLVGANNSCNYVRTPIICGVKNKHWTLTTHVHVGQKYAIINARLFNERGVQVGYAQKTEWGEIREIPQWKYTRIKDSGDRYSGPRHQEIFEQFPPKIEELPPLITPTMVFHVIGMVYSSYKPL